MKLWLRFLRLVPVTLALVYLYPGISRAESFLPLLELRINQSDLDQTHRQTIHDFFAFVARSPMPPTPMKRAAWWGQIAARVPSYVMSRKIVSVPPSMIHALGGACVDEHLTFGELILGTLFNDFSMVAPRYYIRKEFVTAMLNAAFSLPRHPCVHASLERKLLELLKDPYVRLNVLEAIRQHPEVLGFLPQLVHEIVYYAQHVPRNARTGHSNAQALRTLTANPIALTADHLALIARSTRLYDKMKWPAPALDEVSSAIEEFFTAARTNPLLPCEASLFEASGNLMTPRELRRLRAEQRP